MSLTYVEGRGSDAGSWVFDGCLHVLQLPFALSTPTSGQPSSMLSSDAGHVLSTARVARGNLQELIAAIGAQFKAAVAVCGAFKFYDFTMWHRYANVFQPLIIPAILTDLVSKYGPQLMHQLGLVGLKVLCTSDRYSQLSQRLFSRIHNVPSDYAEWQALQEPLRHRHNIKTPFKSRPEPRCHHDPC